MDWLVEPNTNNSGLAYCDLAPCRFPLYLFCDVLCSPSFCAPFCVSYEPN